MVWGSYYARVAWGRMLEAVAKESVTVKTTQTVVKITFPVVVALLAAAARLIG
ncbi:hypothetical protein ACFLTC_00705 [Chloroflexota bacterium]